MVTNPEAKELIEIIVDLHRMASAKAAPVAAAAAAGAGAGAAAVAEEITDSAPTLE